jgi:hypothetical protein
VIQVIQGPDVEVPSREIKSALAFCPTGMGAVSGGGDGSLSGILASETDESRVGWFIIVDNETLVSEEIHAQVLCTSKGQVVTATAWEAERRRMEQHVAALVAKLKAEK